MRAAALPLLTLVLGGCAGVRSSLMIPATATPLLPTPDKAIIVFTTDKQIDEVFTLVDENKKFLAELSIASVFRVEVPPGRHAFGAAPLRRSLGMLKPPGCRWFNGDFEGGKIYLVWWKPEPIPESAIVNYRWIFLRPDNRLMNPAEAYQGKLYYLPDVAAGQKLIESVPERMKPCAPSLEPHKLVGASAPGLDVSPEFGFTAMPE